MSLPAAPVWLNEEPWLAELLRWCLTRQSEARQRQVTRRISPRTIPALFDFAADTEYRWSLIQILARDHQVFEIRLDRPGPGDEPYLGAQLRFNPATEDRLREWLGQPRTDPYVAAWQAAVQVHQDCFADAGQALLAYPLRVSGYAAAELVEGFARISGLLDRPRTLRQLSSICFRGHSKLLEERQELLHTLFGSRASSIEPRALLLIAWAPPSFSQLLLIENQDTFLRLASAAPREYALVYSAGFRATAQRLKSPHTRYSFLPGSDHERFLQSWSHVPAWFWGDLDYSGLAIIKSLRQLLPQLQAWEPGYRPMLELIESGGGHLAEHAAKTGQRDAGETGCPYADQYLLPALRKHHRFADQEIVDLSTLDTAIKAQRQ